MSEMMPPTATGGLVGQPATVLAALVQSGSTNAVDVVQAHLDCIARLDARIGAFQTLRADKALAEAVALSSRRDRNALPLAGVPIAIKDAVPVAGEPLRIGSQATPASVSTIDHETVKRLKAAGAIIVGTTRVPELCLWGTTDSAFGVTRNPWNPAHTAGGSSGGSAAAVASSMVPIALGTDGLGSIRIPASACGVFGIKPGAGVVSGLLGVSSWHGLTESGPLATTVDDAALMLSILAQRPDLAHPLPPTRPLRLAVSTRSPSAGVTVDPGHVTATLDAAVWLGAAGHTVERADPPVQPARSVIAQVVRWLAGAAEDAQGLDRTQLEPRTRTHVRVGRIARRALLVRPNDRENWRRRLAPFFETHDLLVTPALGSRPLACEMWSERGWLANAVANVHFTPFTGAWNLAGFPAAAVPIGVLSDGLPVAIQIVGSAGREGLILSLAKQIEMLRPWPRYVSRLTT